MDKNPGKIPALLFFCFALFTAITVPAPHSLDALAATNFGIDYRYLTPISPGATPDTTTTILIGSGATGAIIVDPYTSGSTATGTPSTASLSGYGWRTAGVVGSSVPAGIWSITVTTQASLTSLLSTVNVKVFVYSTDTLGSDLSFIGSATGTSNLLSILLPQTETLTFSAAPVDLTNRVLVVEYWIDVTTAPLLATTVTFQAASSTQNVVLPSSDTFYLGNPSVFSIGESESATISDAFSRSVVSTRGSSESPTISDSSPSRAIMASRSAVEVSGGLVIDSVSKFKAFTRVISETSGAVIGAITSGVGNYSRQVSELSSALATDAISRTTMIARGISETSALVADLINAVLGAVTPPEDEDEERENRGGGGGSRRAIIDNEPSPAETPSIEDETPVKGRQYEVRVSETVGIETGESPSKAGGVKASSRSGALNVTISASLKGISTSFLTIPPSATGTVIFEIKNNADNMEDILFQYWCFDERTGDRLVEGEELLSLSPYQSTSKQLDITFQSPGNYILETRIAGNAADGRVMPPLKIDVPWTAVYFSLLTTIIALAIPTAGLCIVVIRQKRKKGSRTE